MSVLCVTTPLGDYYSITDSKIVHLLGNYINYGGLDLQRIAERELCYKELISQFDIFYKDIHNVLYNNFKVKKKMKNYNDIELASGIIGYMGCDDSNYFRNSLIAILKILKYIRNEVENYKNVDFLNNRDVFVGEATFLHLLLMHIEEFAGIVATVKEKKNYCRIRSRKKILATEVFDLSRRLPRSQTYSNEMTHLFESIFLIRQAIELKVVEALCISSIYNKKNKSLIKISPDKFIELLDDKCVSFQSIGGKVIEVNINFIKKVHSWTNLFVHSGQGYWFWEVEFVRTILNDFIFSNIVIENTYLKEIPNKIKQCIKEDERGNADIIMTKRYYDLLGNKCI